MTSITIVGNLTADPELRFTPQGKAVANFTVAASSRIKQDGEWKDGPSTFWRCSLWDTQAENMAESLAKGQRIIVVGTAQQRSFETREGEKRTVIEVTASEVGPSLRWATTKVERASVNGPGRDSAARNTPPQGGDTDPWGSSPQNGTDEAAPF